MTSDKGKVAKQQQVRTEAIGSCYATEPVSTGQKWPGLETIKENHCLTMAHSHVYSLRAERIYSSSSEKCLLLVKHDQIGMQMNHRRLSKDNCAPSPSFARSCESHICSKIYTYQTRCECVLY